MRHYRKLAVAVLVGLCAGAAAPAIAQEHKFTYQSYATRGWAAVETDMWLLDEISKRSNGAIEFETYFGGSLLGAREIAPGTGQGVIQIGNIPVQYNPDLLPLSDIVQPFITSRLDAASDAVHRLYKENAAFAKEYADNNLKLLYVQVVPESIIATNQKIEGPQDLQGLRIRAQSIIGEVIDSFGGTSVAIPWGEAVDVFQRGGIDGLSSAAFDIAVTSGVHEVATHFGDLGGAGAWATIMTAMNVDAYNSLSPELQAVIDEVAAEAPAKYFEILNEHVEKAIETVANSKSVTITLSSEEDVAVYREAAAQFRAAWIERMEQRGLPASEVMGQYIEFVNEAEATSTFEPLLKRALERRNQN